MAFYLILYIVATLCAFCYAKAKTKIDILIFKTLLFLILFLPLALRYNIGTDYPNYVYLIKEYYFFKHNYLYFEPGWMPIIYAIEKWNLSLQWFFVVPAFFSTLIVLNEDVMERKYAHFCIPAYISIAYLRSFTAVRQLFTATIFLLCIKHFEQKEYGKMLFWLIIAFLFHKSAIILLPILILASFDWKKLNQYRALAIYAIMVAVFVIYNAAAFIMQNIAGNTFYANYITNSTWNRAAEINSGLGVLV
ncbi:MAG: EpsG family protein, partial [Paludibacteraceae bacterium]|nr:EpsG family protein [Paludibacteraceae bacterium]